MAGQEKRKSLLCKDLPIAPDRASVLLNFAALCSELRCKEHFGKKGARATMTLKPLGDKLVVKRQEAGEKTKGGIILPDTAKEKPQIGKVIAVGDGRLLKDGRRVELQVKKGDTILFSAYAGDEFELDGEKVLLMREEDVLAIVEE
jgi:chaperonin GroES